MDRREVLKLTAAFGSLAAVRAQTGRDEPRSGLWRTGTVTPEPATKGTPRAGSVLAAIQPHADDIPLYAAGTVARLIREGCTGYMIRITNDEKAGPGSMGETVLANERDTAAVARVLGLKRVFDFNYRNHRLDDASRQDLRARLIFLFRLLRVDTIVSYDPWGMYEENPDHYVTAQMVESACWMAGGAKDYPEHFEAGLKPHGVREKYYFARGPQVVNRVVDISATVDVKVESNLANVAQGPGGESGARLRAALRARKIRLPILGDDDETAKRQYVKHIVLDIDSVSVRGIASDRETGKPYGFEWAEAFHYIGPTASQLEPYISDHGTPLP